MAFHAADQVHGDEAQHTAFRRLDNEMTETRNGHAAWAALIHQRGDAGTHADHIGIQTEAAGHMLINMGVRVDHAGSDDLARDVQHLARRADRKCGFDCRDAFVANADIGDAIAPRCRIDHPAAT